MRSILALIAGALLVAGCDPAPNLADPTPPHGPAALAQWAEQAASVPQFALLTLTAQQQLREARAHTHTFESVLPLVAAAGAHLDHLHGYLSPAQHEEAERIYRSLERLASSDLTEATAERLDEANFRRLNALLRDLGQNPRG